MKYIELQSLLNKVEEITGVSQEKILGNCRDQDIKVARFLMGHFAYEWCDESTSVIGKFMNINRSGLGHMKNTVLDLVLVVDKLYFNHYHSLKIWLKGNYKKPNTRGKDMSGVREHDTKIEMVVAAKTKEGLVYEVNRLRKDGYAKCENYQFDLGRTHPHFTMMKKKGS